MAEITRLPCSGCHHHIASRCLYQEHLNPGYSTQWRCRVLQRWETAFDEFLARAESLGVSQEAMPGLWGRRFERMAREAFRCEDYVFEPGGAIPACAHVLDGLCRLALPEGEGRCRHYRHESKKD